MVTRDCLCTQPSFAMNSAAAPGPSAAVPNKINTINTIAVKLPQLWQSKVCSWFAQAEAQFVNSGVTMSLTKYYHVIKALQESSIKLIPGLLVPQADDPNSVLKRWLIELYDLSDYERAELLMALPQVNRDIRPSMLLNKMMARRTRAADQPLLVCPLVKTTARYLRALCAVHFIGVETLADVARRADAQFRARPRPSLFFVFTFVFTFVFVFSFAFVNANRFNVHITRGP